MAHPLAGVRAKLKRATKHLRELNAKAAAFLGSDPYRIDVEPEDDPRYVGWHRATFRIVRYPPFELGVIVGEVFGQYRSALDHLMVRLIRLNQISGRVKFPIYPDGVYWVPNKEGRVPRDRLARLVRSEHLAVFDRLYPRPDQRRRRVLMTRPHALVMTQWVSNFDKHELVRPSFLAPRQMGVSMEPRVGLFEWVHSPAANLYDGALLYRVKFVSEGEVDVPYRLVPDLTFGEPPHEWIAPLTVRLAGARIRSIVQSFVRVTPELRERDDANPN